MLLETLGVEPRPFGTNGKIAFAFLNYLVNILTTNLLFVTREGYMGLAPRNSRGGDFVAIFNGCDMPYVVWPVWNVKYEGKLFGGGFQVVGPGFLHGIMNGEIFTDREALRFSRLKWTRRDGDPVDSLEGWMALV
jgi:hypothetical protein